MDILKKTLLKGLKEVNIVTAVKNPAIKLTATGQTLRMYAANEAVTIETEVAANSSDEFQCVINGKLLSAVLVGISAKVISVEKSENCLVIKNGASEIQVTTMAETLVPDRPQLKDVAFDLVSSDLMDYVRKTAHARTSHTWRPVFTCFNVRLMAENHIRVMTTDAYRVSSRGSLIDETLVGEVNIDGEWLIKVAKLFPTSCRIRALSDAGSVRLVELSWDGLTVTLPLLPGSFPDLAHMLRNLKTDIQVTINGQLFASVLSSSCASEWTSLVVLQFRKQGVVNIACQECGTNMEIDLPVVVDEQFPDEGITITLTLSFLLDAVKSLGNSDIVLTLSENPKLPVKLESADKPDACEVLMPRR